MLTHALGHDTNIEHRSHVSMPHKIPTPLTEIFISNCVILFLLEKSGNIEYFPQLMEPENLLP
jgi:hypothetical protein